MKLLIILLLGLTACGPAWKLRRAGKLMAQAIGQGAKVRMDTVYREVYLPGSVTHDTVTIRDTDYLEILKHDTVVMQTTRWKSKTHYDTIFHRVFQQVEIKPDSIKAPLTENTTISAGIASWWRVAALVLGAVVAAGIVARVFKIMV